MEDRGLSDNGPVGNGQVGNGQVSMDWRRRKALVTGGASFIGSHLVEALLARGAEVRVIDNLSSGVLSNVKPYLDRGEVEFIEGDLLHQADTERAVKGMDVVFHLAADHGGRGYVDLHQAACASNLALDGICSWPASARVSRRWSLPRRAAPTRTSVRPTRPKSCT